MGDIAAGVILHITIAVIILFAGWWGARYLRDLIVRIMQLKRMDAMLTSFTGNVVYIGLLVFIIMAALAQLGVQTTSLVAVIGAAGLAIGLALQNSLSNFAAGVIIIFFRPFKVGDLIEAAGVSGTVEGIQIFSTELRTGDNKMIIVPNSSITSGNIINFSAREIRRVDLMFGVGYDADIKKVKIILQELVDQDARILKDPAPVIAISSLDENSVNFIVWPWVKTEDYSAVQWDLTEAVKLRFDQDNISFPLPQRNIYLHQT